MSEQEQCTGPFSDAFGCPVHDPRRKGDEVETPEANPDSRVAWKARAKAAEADRDRLRGAIQALLTHPSGRVGPEDDYCWWCGLDINGKLGAAVPHDLDCPYKRAADLLIRSGEGQT